MINIFLAWLLVELFFSLNNLKSKFQYIDNKVNQEKTNSRPLIWWEPWSYHTYNVNLVSSYNPWELYTKYRLSIWTNWHILEDRICLFAVYIYIFLL